jgi:hopanoid biosynthesis associated RND transporter like protein HpnN
MKLKILEKWGGFVATHPWHVIIGIIVAVILAGFSARNLNVTTRWSDLLPVHDPMVSEFNHILEEYNSASNTIIVVQGEETEIKRFCEEIVPRITALKDFVERVDYKIEEDFVREHGFMLIRTQDLEKSTPVFEDLNVIPLLSHINDNFEAVYTGEDALSTKEKEDNTVIYLDGLQFWIQTMDRFVSSSPGINQASADSAVDRFLLGEPYFISYDKHTLLITIKPTFSVLDAEKMVASTDSIQHIIDQEQAKFPGVKAGLTGTIPLGRDEVVYSTNDMKTTSVIALILVLLLFIITFRMWSAPLLAMLNLIVAIIISAGVSAVFLESLNIMTSMFIVIIIGLGIDYSIHIISLYSEWRARDSLVIAVKQSLVRSGSGIITGGLTTAAAFFALMISQTRGIKEMGLILGIGIVCAMMTTLIALPAFLAARERISTKLRHKEPRSVNVEFKVLGSFGKIITRRPGLFLILAVILTAFFAYQALHAKFDYNYLNMEPKGIASVALQDTMVRAFDLSPDFAMVTAASPEESWAIAEQAKKTPAVSMVEDISQYLPLQTQQTERIPYLKKIRTYLRTNTRIIPLTRANLADLIEQLKRLDLNIYELSQLAYIGGQDKVDLKCQGIIGAPDDPKAHNMIDQLIAKIRENPELARRQLNLFQSYAEPTLRKTAYKMANPELITLETIPGSIKRRFLNKDGDKYLVTIFPKQQVWDFEFLRRFAEQMQRIRPKITGSPLMFLRLIDYTGQDGLRATILTLIIVFILLLIDFRNFGYGLVAMIPLIAGGIWMVGLMRTFGMMFTFVNVIGIPMIVGIGIDDGVHLLHRYRLEGLTKTPSVLQSTGKAILLTSLTTMVGFGSLLPAKYRGFTSLGTLLVIGVAMCFLTTVVILPSIIALLPKKTKPPEHPA